MALREDFSQDGDASSGSGTPPTGSSGEVQPGAVRSRHRRGAPRVLPWWVRLHRWIALVLGVGILLECVSGAVLLVRPEIERWGHAGWYQSTPSEHPISGYEAVAAVQRQRPDFGATDKSQASGFAGVWQVTGSGTDTAFVDPGTGGINAIGNPDPWVVALMVQVHDCFFACEGYPLYLAFLNDTIPLPGADFTIAGYLLGLIALAITFLAVSGLITWWPALRKWGTAFRVRFSKGPYARDLELHKLVGVLAMPLLLMWGVTGMYFAGFQWPSQLYYAVAPGGPPAESEPPVGSGPLLSPRQAELQALAAVPGGHQISYRPFGFSDNQYLFNISTDYDLHHTTLDFGPTHYVSVDAHGGGVVDGSAYNGPQTFWQQTIEALHTGALLPWGWRVILEVTAGLAVVPLALTGITVWLTKWRSRRGRRRADRRRAAAT